MNKYEEAISFFNEECAYCKRGRNLGMTCEMCFVGKSLESLYELLNKCNKLEKDVDGLTNEISKRADTENTLINTILKLNESRDKAIEILRKIDWVGSGAKGLIEDAIEVLMGEEDE